MVAPESTKSGAKRAGGKEGEGAEGANEEEWKEVGYRRERALVRVHGTCE